MTRNLLLLAICFCLFLPASIIAASSSSSKEEAAKQVSAEPAIGSIQAAMNDFKNLSKKERKERLKEVKSKVREFKSEKTAGMEPSTNTLLLVILALFIPPLAVYLHQGEINNKFWISLILTLLLFLPGVIYALITILG